MELINQPQARRVGAIWRIYLINDIEVDVYEFAPVGPDLDDTSIMLERIVSGEYVKRMARFYECTEFDGHGDMSSSHNWYAPSCAGQGIRQPHARHMHQASAGQRRGRSPGHRPLTPPPATYL